MDDREYIAIIPARKYSKRIKNKNILKINGKMIFDYTFNAAQKSNKISKIIVSTDIEQLLKKDSKKIFYSKRPRNLCQDNSSTESVISYTVKYYKEIFKKNKTYIVLLQPTSPLRNSKDIDNAIKFYENGGYDSLFSSYKKKIFLWEQSKNKLKPLNYNLKKRLRSQFMKNIVIENGAIFIFSYNGFMINKNRLYGKIGTFVMDSKNSIDIDEKDDLKVFKSLIDD